MGFDTYNYNIHNILSFQINRKKHRDFIKDINLPYSYFEVEKVDSPDVILNIGDFTPQNDSCYLVDHKWYVKGNYIYGSQKRGRIKFKIEIIDLETKPTVINFSSSLNVLKQLLLPSVLAQFIALRPILDFKLLYKGYVSIHAMAVANESGANIFPGRGGAFKTTLAMDFTRKLGYSFLGDDRVLMNKNNVFSFPLHYKLFDYRINHMKTEDYLFFDKYKFIFFQKSNDRKPKYILDKSPISSIHLIAKSNNEKIEHEQITKLNLIKKTFNSHLMENIKGPDFMGTSKGLYDFFAAYSYVFPNSEIAYYDNNYKSMLLKYLTGDEFYEIFLPKLYSNNIFDQFTKMVNEIELNK